MQIISLSEVLKNRFYKYFVAPLLIVVLLLLTMFVVLEKNKKTEDDRKYVNFIHTPLVNAILGFQNQEAQLLLNSIGKYRGWSKAFLISDKKIISAYPEKERRLIGTAFDDKCESSIELYLQNLFVGKICYSKGFWNFIDSRLITIISALVLILVLIVLLYNEILGKLDYYFKRLSNAIDLLNSNESVNFVPIFREEQTMCIAIQEKLILLENLKEQDIQKAEINLKLQIAEQVSHDVRTPMSVLKSVIENVNLENTTEKKLISLAIIRIENIIDNLVKTTLENNRLSERNVLKVENLIEIVNAIMEEAKVIAGKKVIFNNNLPKEEINVYVDRVEISRVLSNIINNAIDAITNEGEINFHLIKLDNEKIKLLINDNGKGIPEEIIERIGERGFSFGKDGKKGGNGLGLFHAKNYIESINGNFTIKSSKRYGTTVEIILSQIIQTFKYFQNVYIDNDKLALMTWELIAKKKGISLLVLNNIDEFQNYIQNINFDTNIYIDSDLGNISIPGEDFAIMLHQQGFKNLYITTGYNSERFNHLTWLKYSTKKCPF